MRWNEKISHCFVSNLVSSHTIEILERSLFCDQLFNIYVIDKIYDVKNVAVNLQYQK